MLDVSSKIGESHWSEDLQTWDDPKILYSLHYFEQCRILKEQNTRRGKQFGDCKVQPFHLEYKETMAKTGSKLREGSSGNYCKIRPGNQNQRFPDYCSFHNRYTSMYNLNSMFMALPQWPVLASSSSNTCFLF